MGSTLSSEEMESSRYQVHAMSGTYQLLATLGMVVQLQNVVSRLLPVLRAGLRCSSSCV